MKTYLEYQDEKSHKFWEVKVNGNRHTVRYGKVGTDGRSVIKQFENEEKALQDARKKVREKVRKGYKGDYINFINSPKIPEGITKPENAPDNIKWRDVLFGSGFWYALIEETSTQHTVHYWNKYGEFYQELVLTNDNNVLKETYFPPKGVPENAIYTFEDEWKVDNKSPQEIIIYHHQDGKWEVKPEQIEKGDKTEQIQKSKPSPQKKGQKFFLQEIPEKVKPDTIPSEAVEHWNIEEWWCLGKWGESFETGLWKYWFSDGYLFMENIFDEGKVIKRTYFPPQGVPENAIWVEGIQEINDIYYEDCWLAENSTFLKQQGVIYIDCYTRQGEKLRALKLDKNNKVLSDTHIRIENIPEGAIWNDDYNEWQLGEKNEKGKKIDKWQSWDEFGRLVFEAEFSKKGKPITKVVYLESEEPNKYYFYDKEGELIRREFYRKVKNCSHIYPFGEGALAKKAFKVVEEGINGKLSFYDEYDNLLKRKKRKTTWKKYLKAVENETAVEAYNRYIKLLDTLKKEYAEDEDEQNDFEYYKPVIKQKFTKQEVKAIEDETGFKFPPSYTEFVTKIGVLEFRSENHRMFVWDGWEETAPFKKQLNYNWDYDISTDLDEDEQAIMNNVLPFSWGDESLQIVYFHCFNYNTLNTETGEVEVYALDQDDIYCLHLELNTKPTSKCGFDKHIQKVIQEEIEWFLDGFEPDE